MRNSIRFLSRVPRPKPPPSVIDRSTLQRPPRTTDKANKYVNTEEATNLTRKRRFIIYAVGFAVITVAGAILGAQLKSTKQEHDRRKDIETAAQELAVTSNVTANTLQPDVNQKELPDSPTSRPRYKSESPYTIDVARQIALLENRKSLLNRQRATLEVKIEKIRERRIRKEQMDARRANEARGQR